MTKLLAVLLIVAVATPVLARDNAGSYVSLVEPTSVEPGGTYSFTFYVWNNSPDTEWITDVAIHFPDGFTLNEGTMWYEQTHSGHLWNTAAVGTAAWWVDGDGGYGELYDQAGCSVGLEVTVPTTFDAEIFWELWGDVWGGEPHYASGNIELGITAVEEATWSAIKAMFRG